jgi:hypothetical protein
MLSTASSGISIQDRLESGNLTISEVCDLKRRSRSGFYADLKAGLVQIRKQGRISVVPGPIARRYINGGDRARDTQPKENAV